MDPHEVKDLTLRLNGGQLPRVWSVLVTVFGELAQDKNARIEGRQINEILSLMGIKPEAIRVALHRLRKEGWITSAKEGRTSHYMLTDLGRRESAAASPLIYARDPLAETGWLVLEHPSGQGAQGISVLPHVYISEKRSLDKNALSLLITPDQSLPDWVAERLCSHETAAQSALLAKELQTLNEVLRTGQSLEPTTARALRILIVHSWRRIALRVPSLPDALFPAQWAGAACRRHLADVLAQLRLA